MLETRREIEIHSEVTANTDSRKGEHKPSELRGNTDKEALRPWQTRVWKPVPCSKGKHKSGESRPNSVYTACNHLLRRRNA